MIDPKRGSTRDPEKVVQGNWGEHPVRGHRKTVCRPWSYLSTGAVEASVCRVFPSNLGGDLAIPDQPDQIGQSARNDRHPWTMYIALAVFILQG